MKRCHSLQERLSTRRVLMGLLQMRHNPALVEVAGKSGCDFLILDGEHGVFSEDELLQALQALASTDVLAMVRLAGHDTEALGRYLEMGADGIVVPHVSTSEEARELVRAMKVPREGACLIVIIESVLGVSHAEGILALEGVDGALVGPNDLTTDLGCQGDYSQPAYAEALSRIEAAASVAGKFLGTAPHPGYPLDVLLARGHRLFVLASDIGMMHRALSDHLDKARLFVSSEQNPMG